MSSPRFGISSRVLNTMPSRNSVQWYILLQQLLPIRWRRCIPGTFFSCFGLAHWCRTDCTNNTRKKNAAQSKKMATRTAEDPHAAARQAAKRQSLCIVPPGLLVVVGFRAVSTLHTRGVPLVWLSPPHPLPYPSGRVRVRRRAHATFRMSCHSIASTAV